MRPTQLLIFGLLSGLLGCRAERVEGSPTPRAAARPSAAAATATAPAGEHMAWGDHVSWRSWESALRVAHEEDKPICLVVYASWCQHCKELAPVFAQPAVASAARGLVMVHQDQDENPAWLHEQLGAYGTYVPRVLFLSSDGHVREDLTSGHPRYPYFYAPLVTDQLVANMRAASVRYR